jgi:hypothetical protein
VIKENVEVVVPDLEAQEHVGVPRSSVRAVYLLGDMLVMLHWFLPSMRLPIVQRRRGVMMRLTSSMSLLVVQWRRGVIP